MLYNDSHVNQEVHHYKKPDSIGIIESLFEKKSGDPLQQFAIQYAKVDYDGIVKDELLWDLVPATRTGCLCES